MLDFENEANPFKHRKLTIRSWKIYASVDTDETKKILNIAEKFHQIGIKNKDSLHFASAISMQCKYFLTTDDQLLKKLSNIKEIKIIDPLSFIKEET